MDLTKYDSQYNEKEGTYNCLVTDIKRGENSNQKQFLEIFYLVSGSGSEGKFRIYTGEKSLWVLNRFARACGLSDQELQNFKPSMLAKKEFCATWEKNNGYLEPNPKTFQSAKSEGHQDEDDSLPPSSASADSGSDDSQGEDDLPW